MENERNNTQRRSQSGQRTGQSRASSTQRAGQNTQRRSAPRKRRRRSAGRTAAAAALYVVSVIGISVVLAAFAWICAEDVLALNKDAHSATVILEEEYFTERETNTVTVKNADGTEEKTSKTVTRADMSYVADKLKEEGLIEHKWLFKLFSAFTGGAEKIAAGTYELNTDLDYRALISGMSSGSASRAVISVTIPEGRTVEQIFQLLEDRGVSTVEKLNDMAANHDYKFEFLADIPLGNANRLEGYLFPDTYEFYIGEDPLYAINKMLVNFSNQVTMDTRNELKEEGKSLYEILTIASMIEKETDGTDQALIASVIYNRLNNPGASTVGYLQIDATLAYINGGNVPTDADKSIDSPYNTYLYKGLPAGPICNPGSSAIWAAMNPKSTGYYYYALDENGTHHFSKTYAEHQAFLASLSKS